ncbi:MAG: hypothetical protein ACP5JO_01905 [Candidatus Ratteibacteria bacterium]
MENNIFLKAVNPLNEPATFGLNASVPFPRGLLKSTESLILYDYDDGVIPCQKKVLARWNDKSIKVALIDFVLTLTTWTGSNLLKIEPEIHINPEKGVFFRIKELKLSITPISNNTAEVFFPDVRINQTKRIKIFQIDDENCDIEADENCEKRYIASTGTFRLTTNGLIIAGALKDFSMRWPKSIEFDGRSISFGLLPSFKKGTFNHMQPWYKYGYLFCGSIYMLKTGQKRRWEIWLEINGNWQLCRSICEIPPVAIVEPEYATSTGVYGDITGGRRKYQRLR